MESLPDDTGHDSHTLLGLSADVELKDAEIASGQTIGKYEIRRQLGAGGMGAVYLAFDPLIEREVALKVLKPDLGNSPAALQRFLGEARAIGKLNHPHVVSIYDIDRWGGQYYLVMELLSGGSVAERLDQAGRLPWEEATRLIAEAAHGLAAAHAAGLIHRDIKPDNLMLTADGSVKVVDFGLSKLQDSAQDHHSAVTRAGQILGTPQYMSPEQFDTADVDARTDIYSLGATYYHLLTARFPYHECRSIMQMMSAHVRQPAPVPTQFAPDVPAACNRIVAKAMSKKTTDRYQTALEFAIELEALLQPTGSAPKAAEQDRPLSKVLIVEPSKMQGAMLKDALSRAGAATVELLSSVTAAEQAVVRATPDLLITALEFTDGRGIELLQRLCSQSLLSQTTVVLNSSDLKMDDLIAVGSAASLILAPKKAKPEQILRLAHAIGPSRMTTGPLALPINPATVSVVIEQETGRIPEILADMLRALKLLDVEVAQKFDPASGSPLPNLLLIVRSESPSLASADFAALASRAAEAGPLAAVALVEAGKLTLRAVSHQGVVAVCQRTLDERRLVCLLQSCRL